MKKSIFPLFLVVLLVLAGCKDNPTQPFENITQQINDARPFNSIYIDRGDNTVSLGTDGFEDAYAEDGYFVVVFSHSAKWGRDTKSFYNLSTVKEVNIQASHDIYIMY